MRRSTLSDLIKHVDIHRIQTMIVIQRAEDMSRAIGVILARSINLKNI